MVSISQGDKISLATLGASGVVTATYSSIDGFLAGARAIVGDVLIPDEFIATNGSLVKRLIGEKPDATRIIDADGRTASLALHRVDGGTELAVRVSPQITMSPSAWAARGLLEQNIMAGLIGRMRVIALVPRSDQVQRNLLRQRFGNSVRFVEASSALEQELSRTQKRLAVILGHVEDDSFIVRNAANEVILDTKIETVQEILDAKRSVAFLMGCRVACTTSLSGPTQVIDALDTIDGVVNGSGLRTPLEFIEAVASETGPMHIQSDILGRMRAVSASHVSKTERAVRIGAPVARVLVPQNLSHPLTPSYVFSLVAFYAFMSAFMIIASWFMLLFIGVTPSRGWQLGTENYAVVSGRTEDQIEQLSRTEVAVLYAVTPAVIFLNFIPYFCLAALLFVTGVCALLFGRATNFFGFGHVAQMDGTDDKYIDLIPTWANAAMPAAFILILIFVIAGFFVEAFWKWYPDQVVNYAYWLTVLGISILVGSATTFFPRVLNLFDALIMIIVLPTAIGWAAVRFLIVLPLHWIGDRYARRRLWAKD
ncbi:MAG: hypothetical protein AAFY14_12925 [Pseudomonadota bacterium]